MSATDRSSGDPVRSATPLPPAAFTRPSTVVFDLIYHPENTMMLKLAREREELRVVDDEFVSPTPTEQIAKQIVARAVCRGEMECRDRTRQAAVYFLRPRCINIASTKPGFDMAYRYAGIIGGKAGGKRRRP